MQSNVGLVALIALTAVSQPVRERGSRLSPLRPHRRAPRRPAAEQRRRRRGIIRAAIAGVERREGYSPVSARSASCLMSSRALLLL